MKRWGLPAVAIAALALCGPVHASAPPVQAQAYVVQSSVDGRTLAARNADAQRPMASITKLMTVLVALERLPLDRVDFVMGDSARGPYASISAGSSTTPSMGPAVRAAAAHAADQIVEIAYEGTTVPSVSFFPAYAPLNRYTDMLDYEAHPLWVYNPDEAKAMIESLGYTMGDDGYYAKDGTQLTMDIATHEAFIEKQRIAAVLVEQFQSVGINASTRNEAGNVWGDNLANGTFDTQMGWQNCGSVNEPWASMDTLNVKWLLPVGERASFNQWRWSGEAAEQYSALVDQIGTLPLGDPAIDPLFVEAATIYLDNLPTIPITQAKKLIPHNWTYWTNWPTADNNYIQPPSHWHHFQRVLTELEPAQ